ncbi:MAG: hypothetical protein IKU71_09170 [Kiritimatiellae bacterium]|nr:hypothetical protein [Kiritimatiellia bacterium]
MRLAVVGCEASGKTVFMAALADYYRPDNANGLCLVPENSATNRFSRALVRQMRCLRQWPSATNPDKTVEMEWSLRSDGEIIANIDMLEFGGETFRAVFRGEGGEKMRKQSEKALLDYLAAADSVVVLVSIKELLRDPGSVSIEEFERDTEAMWVTRGLLDFAREKLPGAGVVIGLTQADRYRGELAAAGGARKLFSSRWPTIAAAAHSIPVVEVASVSATDENGNPAKGYSTEGVLPVMRELARQNYGELSETKAEMTAILESDVSSASKARKYGAKLTALSRHAALSGEDERDFIKEAQAKLEELNAHAKAERPKQGKKKKSRPKVARPRVRRVFLLALLLASSIALLSQHIGTALDVIKMKPQPETTPAQVEVPQVAPTNEPPAQVEAEQVAQTNEPSAQVEAEQVAATNEPPSQVIITQVEAPQVEAPQVLQPAETEFRLWTDHNGKKIKARWIATDDDSEHITLETPSGKKINAVLRKFSAEDRAYIQSKLDANR